MTAVEFLHSEYKKIIGDTQVTFAQMLKITDALEQAKEMEKQQIIDAWENGYEHGACVNEDKNKYHGIQYYNETFKQL